MKEVYLYKKLKDKKVQCQTCAHNCLVLPDNLGICGVRENKNGKLFALNYGKVIALNVDPIEKKPFFHFLPGTHSLSIATVGCNFRCLNCQNWDISQGFKEQASERSEVGDEGKLEGANFIDRKKEIPGENLSPKQIVDIALKNKLPSISYTYTEPVIFLEYALDTMKLARKAGIKNGWVSNGFLSPESAKLILPFLDAIRIDIKSFSDDFYKEVCGGRLQPVLDTAKMMKKSGVWVEIITLAIPTLSDSEEMFRDIANFIYKELGPETPWHITQFSGVISWKLQDLPETKVETLKKAYEIGKSAGLKYVYTGNVPGMPSEDTFCPKCNTLVIDRTGYMISRHDKQGKCPKCGENLNLILK